MNVADFFSEVRLLAIGTPHQLAVRAANGIAHDWVWGGGRKRLTDTMNMQEFLDVYGSRELLRVPNLGKKSVTWMVRLMREEGLPLSDPKWNTDWL